MTQVAAPARLTFISATPANVRQGSGTFIGIAALRRALLALGHEVEMAAPAQASPALWRRLWFNWRLRQRLRLPAEAVVVGFDLDGLLLPAAGVAAIKGVIAEEMQFEHGWVRARLEVAARLERLRVRQARRVIATSRYAAAALQRRYGVGAEKIRIVPELLDVDAWQGEIAAARVLPHTRPVILCVAHLYPRKDVATLLRAIVRLPEAAHLRVVGDGPERKRLQRLAARLRLGDRVHFCGHVARGELAVEYRNADVFCLPSRQEGFGIVLLEAMAAGLPIVAARAAAIPEVVADCGRLFPPGDAAALAEQLQNLLEDGNTRLAMAASGSARVRRFEAARVAEDFLAALSA